MKNPRIDRLEALLERIRERSEEPRPENGVASAGASYLDPQDYEHMPHVRQALAATEGELYDDDVESPSPTAPFSAPNSEAALDGYEISEEVVEIFADAEDDAVRPSHLAAATPQPELESRARLVLGATPASSPEAADAPPSSSRRPIDEARASNTLQPVPPLDSAATFSVDSREPTLVSEGDAEARPPRASAKFERAVRVGVASGVLPHAEPESFGDMLDATLEL